MNNEMTKEEPYKGKEITRYHLKTEKNENSLGKALEWSKELQKLEQPYKKEDGKWYIKKWRVGVTTPSNLILDIDNHNEKNLALVMARLHELFPNDKFVVFKTLHGYQIIDTLADKRSFQSKNLRVLNTKLPIDDPEAIIEYREKLKEMFDNGTDFNAEFKTSGLFSPVGEIDYLYNFMGALNGYYSIRITKKSPTDKWEILT